MIDLYTAFEGVRQARINFTDAQHFWCNQLKCVAADNDKNVTGLGEQSYKVRESAGYS